MTHEIAARKCDRVTLRARDYHCRRDADIVNPRSARAIGWQSDTTPTGQPDTPYLPIIVHPAGMRADDCDLPALTNLEQEILAAAGASRVHEDSHATRHRKYCIHAD